jgi:hypothetical protein
MLLVRSQDVETLINILVISHNAKFMFSAYIYIYIYNFISKIIFLIYFFIYFGIICLTKSFIHNDVHLLVGNLQSVFLKNCTCHQLIKLGANMINTNMDKRITPWRLLEMGF